MYCFIISNKLGGCVDYVHCSPLASSIQERALCPLPQFGACKRNRRTWCSSCLSAGANQRLRRNMFSIHCHIPPTSFWKRVDARNRVDTANHHSHQEWIAMTWIASSGREEMPRTALQMWFWGVPAVLKMKSSPSFLGHARTKRFMSDAQYQQKKFLYLPASQAAAMAEAPPPPGKVWLLHQFKVVQLFVGILWGLLWIWFQNLWQFSSTTLWTSTVTRTRPCGGMLPLCVQTSGWYTEMVCVCNNIDKNYHHVMSRPTAFRHGTCCCMRRRSCK